MEVRLTRSDRKHKKYKVVVDNKTIHFGDSRYLDYTHHKDEARKQRYINRHKSNENWSKSGIKTAGFWSKHLLWNQPTIKGSIRNIESRFNVNIV